MGYFDTLKVEEQVSYLIKPILKVLSQARTPLMTSEIRSRIIQVDANIAEFANTEYTSKRTGNKYKKFTIKFGLALKELIVLDLVNRQTENKTFILTYKGRSLNLESLDVEKDIRKKAQLYWKEKRKKVKEKQEQNVKETTVANNKKNVNRLLWRATANSEESGFSWYQLEEGDIVTYKYATEKKIEIGRFGLGYNKDSGDGPNQPASSVSCIF